MRCPHFCAWCPLHPVVSSKAPDASGFSRSSARYGDCPGPDPIAFGHACPCGGAAERHGERTAIICGDVAWSYGAFRREKDRLASGLRRLDLKPGDRVAILARNSHAFIALRFAIARADTVLVPINFMLNADDVRYILDHSGARALFVDETTVQVGLAARSEQVEHLLGIDGENVPPPAGIPSWTSLPCDEPLEPEERGGEDLLQIVYTSGTESRPKCAMLSHNSVL